MSNEIKEVSVHELKQMFDEKKDFQLIDVRELDEHEFCNIGGELIPLGTIMNNLDKIDKQKQVVVYCRSGARSGRIIAALQQQCGMKNLFNLSGGILAWSDEIDPNIPQY